MLGLSPLIFKTHFYKETEQRGCHSTASIATIPKLLCTAMANVAGRAGTDR
jgi:hypothetical protein